jgi:hypothetical protein
MQHGPAAARELAGLQAPRESAASHETSLLVGIEARTSGAVFPQGFVRQALEFTCGLAETALPLSVGGDLGEDGLSEGVLFRGGELGGGLEGFFEQAGHGCSYATARELDAEYTSRGQREELSQAARNRGRDVRRSRTPRSTARGFLKGAC